MSEKANPTVVGAFVLGALLLGTAALIFFGGSTLFEEKFHCIAFFEESIGGLDIGAPVEFKGVRVGTVTDVRLEVNPERQYIRRPVTIQLEPRRITYVGDKAARNQDMCAGFCDLVEQGLQSTLVSQSLLTGKLKIELDFYPDKPAAPSEYEGELPELPTRLSPLAGAMEKLRELPLADIVTEIHQVAKNLNEFTGDEEFKVIIKNLNETLASAAETTRGIDGHLAALTSGATNTLATVQTSLTALSGNFTNFLARVEGSLDDLQEQTNLLNENLVPTLKEFAATARTLTDMLSDQSSVRRDAGKMIKSITDMLNKIESLADYIERHPESLLRGKP